MFSDFQYLQRHPVHSTGFFCNVYYNFTSLVCKCKTTTSLPQIYFVREAKLFLTLLLATPSYPIRPIVKCDSHEKRGKYSIPEGWNLLWEWNVIRRIFVISLLNACVYNSIPALWLEQTNRVFQPVCGYHIIIIGAPHIWELMFKWNYDNAHFEGIAHAQFDRPLTWTFELWLAEKFTWHLLERRHGFSRRGCLQSKRLRSTLVKQADDSSSNPGGPNFLTTLIGCSIGFTHNSWGKVNRGFVICKSRPVATLWAK